MGIVVLILSGYWFNRRIRGESTGNRRMMWRAVFLYFVFSLILNWYLRDVYGWKYGIPGSDLQKYFEGAQALVNGSSFSDLIRISSSFEVTPLHLGYLAYISFIAITALSPVIFTMEISLQILYLVQAFVAIAAALNIADFFCKSDEDFRLRNRILWMLLLCTSVMQMHALLMRDIWILFFITCLMHECQKKNSSIVRCLVFAAISFLLRYYTLAVTIPILMAYKFKKKKSAAVVSLVAFAVFFVGQAYIDRAASIVGIGWSYHYSFDLYSLAAYILFPSPFSQAYNVQHMNTSYHAVFGGNTEWIYYMLSCWNVYVFPISAYGIYRSIRDGEGVDATLWGMMIINMAMLMCLFYNSSSPRHKLLIVIGIAYFFKKGFEATNSLLKVIYFFSVTIGLIGIFALA